jgi:hypothetical protein
LPLPYTHTGGNLFTMVDARGNGHRDFFTCDDGLSTFPDVPCYVVHEVGRPERPGPPAGVRATRNPVTGELVVAWPYDWGAARYEVWRSTSSGTRGKKLIQTRLTRFVDTTAAAGRSYYYSVRALNNGGKSLFASTPSANR